MYQYAMLVMTRGACKVGFQVSEEVYSSHN